MTWSDLVTIAPFVAMILVAVTTVLMVFSMKYIRAKGRGM